MPARGSRFLNSLASIIVTAVHERIRTAEQQRPFKHKYLHLLCSWVTDIILPPWVYHQYANANTIKKKEDLHLLNSWCVFGFILVNFTHIIYTHRKREERDYFHHIKFLLHIKKLGFREVNKSFKTKNKLDGKDGTWNQIYLI